MASVAKSVVDVILGEAKAGSFQDMLGIASVIANRASSLGVLPQSVVSAKGEFAAYGKPLPAGVERYRDLAQKAIDQVEQRGPITGAQFYAKSSATKNLPKGLSPDMETDGHRYFTDPQARSIRTAEGFKTPSLVSPATATIDRLSPDAQGKGLGLAALAPDYNPDARETLPRTSMGILSALDPNTDLESRPLSNVIDVSRYNPNAGRSLMPSSNVVDDVQAAVTKHFGPQYSVGIYSGQEPAGRAPVNSPKNHPGGWAVDFDVVSPDGNRLDMTNPTHAAALTQVQRDLAAQGHAIGYGEGYMAPGRTHAGSPPGSPVVGWGWDSTRNSMDMGLYSQLAAAKLSGVNLPYTGPVPSQKPDFRQDQYATGIAGIVNPVDTTPVEKQDLAPISPTTTQPPAVQPGMSSMATFGADARQQSTYTEPAKAAPMPTYDQAMAGLPKEDTTPAAPAQRPSFVANPQLPPLPPATFVRTVPQPAQVQAPTAVQQNPPAQMPTAMQVWQGTANQGIATNGDKLSRNPDGTITRESAKYGWTQQMDPAGNIIGGSGAKSLLPALLGPFAQPAGIASRVGQNILGMTALGRIAERLSQTRTPSFGIVSGLGFPNAPTPFSNPGDGSLTGFGQAAAAGEAGQQAGYAANNPGKGLW